MSIAVGAPIYASDLYQPVARLTRASNQSINNNSFTAIQFTAAAVDSHGGWAASPNPSRWTAPLAGRYLVSGKCTFASNTTGMRYLYPYVNGSQISDAGTNENAGSTAAEISLSLGGTLLALAAGDYVELRAWQNSGGALNIGDTASMSVVRIVAS